MSAEAAETAPNGIATIPDSISTAAEVEPDNGSKLKTFLGILRR